MLRGLYRKLVLAILFNITLLGNPPHKSMPPTRYHGYALNREAIKRTKLATVLISTEGFMGTSRGTGVIIDATHVLTVFHVADKGAEEQQLLVYYYPGYIAARGKIVQADWMHDLAILEVDVPTTGCPYPKFQADTWDGEPVTIIGNALGSMQWYVTYGIISGRGGHFLYLDGTQVHGDSGGPWINEKGEIVALADWGLESTDGKELPIYGGVDSKTIIRFLKEWKDSQSSPMKDAKGGVVMIKVGK